jgi:hypothetical protein
VFPLSVVRGQGDAAVSGARETHPATWPLEGPGGQTIPAPNKPVRLTFCGVGRIEGGEIAEEHNFFDLLGMMAQLGVAP